MAIVFSWIVSPLISGLMGPQIQAAPLATHLLEEFSEMIRVAVGKQKKDVFFKGILVYDI